MKFKSSLLRVNGLVNLVSVPFLLVACDGNERQSLVWMQEQEKIELTHQLELKNYRLSQANTGEVAQLQEVRTQILRNTGALSSLQERKAVVSEQLDLLKTQWAQLKESTISERRRMALGKTFDRLELASGRKFEKVSVVSIDDAGVAIRHTDGSARLRYSDLDDSQRVLFGIEADSALVALEKEAADTSAYEKAVVTSIAAVQEKKREEAAKRTIQLAKLEQAASKERLANVTEPVVSSRPRELAEPAVPVGSRTSRYYNNTYYRDRNNSSRYVYYYTPSVYSGQPYFGPNPSPNAVHTPTLPSYQFNSTPSYSTSCP